MVDAAKGVIKAKVTTAIELPESSLTNIKNYLSKRVNAQIEMDVEINAELLGGFILKYDDKLIDASVSSQLKELRKSLLNSN
jgi:F-type H+-transporting ATPase subunit delta